MKGRIKAWGIVIALALIIAIVLSTKAYGISNNDNNKALQAANELHELGLFNGVGTNSSGEPIYNLDQEPTRNQAIIMLVRLLGKEKVATSNIWYVPFEDVSTFSVSYYSIGYAYNHGLINGISDTVYGGSKVIKSNQYIAFILRALGYKSPEDFKVSKSYEFANSIGLTHGDYDATNKRFTRGDIAIISCRALDIEMASGGTIREQIEKNQASANEVYLDMDMLKYESYNDAVRHMNMCPHDVNYQNIYELRLDSADVISYAYVNRNNTDEYNFGMAIIYIDGTVYRLPLPEMDHYFRHPGFGLWFDRDTRCVKYDAYHYTYSYAMESRSMSVEESHNTLFLDLGDTLR